MTVTNFQLKLNIYIFIHIFKISLFKTKFNYWLLFVMFIGMLNHFD